MELTRSRLQISAALTALGAIPAFAQSKEIKIRKETTP